MTVLTEYYVGCDVETGDGYCLARSTTQSSHSLAVLAAKSQGWTVEGEGGFHICPRHNGNDR